MLVPEKGSLDAILIATGSEVSLAVAAAKQLTESGRGVRVVSMPCAEVFDAQEAAYRLFKKSGAEYAKRVRIEAAKYTEAPVDFVATGGGATGAEDNARETERNARKSRATLPPTHTAPRRAHTAPYYFLCRTLPHTRCTGPRPARRAEVALLFLV